MKFTVYFLSMRKLLSTFILILFALTALTQNADQYFKTHHYSFTLSDGFDNRTVDTLKQKLDGYKLILLGEGGSHFLQFYEPLRFVWIKFLSDNLGLKHFFMEFGHSSDFLCNEYLETGDTSYLPKASFTAFKIFWTSLYSYNLREPENKKVKSFGIDFERTHSYCKTLKLLLPEAEPPTTIKSAIKLIRDCDDTIINCDYILSLNSKLKDAITTYELAFQQYFGDKYYDVKQIVFNNGSCKDALKNRNKNMAANFLSFDNKNNDKIYYGELGMAHTILINKNTASYINDNSKFKNKVCVINTYCYNCSTPQEQVSNWQLKKIENDIINQLLKYCNTDFTLFDFSEKTKQTEKFRKYGQFLIIAKNQH